MDAKSDKKDDDARATINLTVTVRDKWDYKRWCVEHRLSQVDAFREAFRLLRAAHGEERS